MARKTKAEVREMLNVKSLARSHTASAVRTLAAICKSPRCSMPARVMAANALLDRGWGKPIQPLAGSDGDGDLKITIRQIIDAPLQAALPPPDEDA
jgi:hypothetical protein